MDKEAIAGFLLLLAAQVMELRQGLPGEMLIVAELARSVVMELDELRLLAADVDRVPHHGMRRKLQGISDDAETLYVFCTLLAQDETEADFDRRKLMDSTGLSARAFYVLAEKAAAHYAYRARRPPFADRQAKAASLSEQGPTVEKVPRLMSFEVDIPTDRGFERRRVATKKIGPTRVPVYFGTTRTENPNGTLAQRFYDGRSDQDRLTFGIAEISLPPGHQIGELEEPFEMWSLRLTARPNKHVMVRELTVVEPGEWVNSARSELENAKRASAFVFIHGFNVTFSQSIKRAAQIAHDINYQGLVTAFSWESKGSVIGYGADGEAAQLAVTHLRDFLAKLHDEVGISELHIVAHSMGTRALLGALESPPFWNSGRTPIVEAVFAAPDVDATVYKRAICRLLPHARRFTLYASRRDITMALSGLLRNTYPRAGDAGDGIVVVQGMDTIDATAIGDHLFGLGHSYVANKPSILRDLWALIRGIPVPRHRMIRHEHANGHPYWELQP